MLSLFFLHLDCFYFVEFDVAAWQDWLLVRLYDGFRLPLAFSYASLEQLMALL